MVSRSELLKINIFDVREDIFEEKRIVLSRKILDSGTVEFCLKKVVETEDGWMNADMAEHEFSTLWSEGSKIMFHKFIWKRKVKETI